jgi:diguanylate cyclase (GGDEF)-like protein
MQHVRNTMNVRQNESLILQRNISAKMLIACFFSCILAIVLTALLSYYLLMAVFISVLICINITTPLYKTGKIGIDAACLAPMLILCFVYTPLSWFTFNGLMGCTPYLSILFITMITLTYYHKIHILMLSLYGALLLGLTIHWLATWPGEKDMGQIMNILVAYILTVTVIVFIIEGVKRKNSEINTHITDLSLRDDLTGLLNRRAIEQILSMLEGVYKKEGHEYAAVMLDIDKFKSINDFFGHNLGDSVLKSMAASIQKSIRSEDYAFRLGGDEFLIVLPNVNKGTAYQICARIESVLREIQGYAFPLIVSKGCALRSESASTTELIELADRRMYIAKQSQSNDDK